MATTYKKGDKDIRPWGSWEVLETAENYCVKKICVKPSGLLSLQLHNHRTEHWVFVEGEAQVTLGTQTMLKKAGETAFIPVKTKHRVENKTNSETVFIEIQIGDNLDENDIIRFDDKYGRI